MIKRVIFSNAIRQAVRDAILRAEFNIPCAARRAMSELYDKEESELPRFALSQILENQEIAQAEQTPICQDTGMIIVFAEVGQDVRITGGFEQAIQDGAKDAFGAGYLRASIVKEPIFSRTNTHDNSPAIIHTRLVMGNEIHLLVIPKGFGSENMSRLSMLTPADGLDGVRSFIVETVRLAGGNPCPPLVVGVGVGGSMESCAIMAKRATAREIGTPSANAKYAELEQDCLKRINALGIGASGFGGNATAIAVHIDHAPTHIAGLPVAVNLCCHACRHASCVL
jgi:fumarate hydratase subunit alpha